MRPGRGFQLARKEFGMRLWQMLGYQVRAQGKIIGDLEDFLIDVQTWAIPYLTLRTGGELSDAEALAPTAWVLSVNANQRSIEFVSDLGGSQSQRAAQPRPVVSSLWKLKELAALCISSIEGPCGICVDLLANTENWTLPYLVANTRRSIPDQPVLIPTTWVRHITWDEMKMDVSEDRLMQAQASGLGSDHAALVPPGATSSS
jgi:hypothetical protein